MTGIVLSNSVRQNLLSLQSTSQLLSATQNQLATGKAVNSALDNPTNFFTAQNLDNRASDINNLLDSIGNGVQILQAANTGITSLQKLVSQAQSLANQALQTPSGYSAKSNVSTTITGATANDLRGTTTYSNATAVSNVLFSGAAGGATAAVSTLTLGGIVGTEAGTAVTNNDTTAVAITTATLLNDVSSATSNGVGTATVTAGQSFTVDGHTITFASGAVPSAAPSGSSIAGNLVTDGSGNSTIYIGASATTSTANVGDVLHAIDLASGAGYNNAGTITVNAGQTLSSITAGALQLKTSTGADLSITGSADFLHALGLTTATGGTQTTLNTQRTTSSATVANLIQAGSTLNVDGKTITFANAATPASTAVASGSGLSGNLVTDGAGNSTVYLQSATIADINKAIDLATGVQTASNTGGNATLTTTTGDSKTSIVTGALNISTGTTADLSISGTGNALSALGLTGSTGTGTVYNASRGAGSGGINGKTLTFSSFNGGTAVNVTFGDGTNGTVKTLAQLNAALGANNQTATVDANGVLTISASNDFASSTLGSADGGVIGGNVTTAQNFTIATAPVADPVAQTTRSNLVDQYNSLLDQITSTAADSSFNGVNLLNGDTLKLVFDETGRSTLDITGVTYNSSGLGLANLTRGVDFIDNSTTNKVLTTLQNASTTLRSEASALGSNLTVVQTRQDFSKDLINVLQTGSSNLTLADTNAEAANSQALSTRQSIAVSALSLANQSQQSVLQLLR